MRLVRRGPLYDTAADLLLRRLQTESLLRMSAKRYAVQAQVQRFDVWEPIYYTDDLEGANRYADAMLKSQEIRAIRVVDQTSGETVVDTSNDQTVT